MNDTIFSYWEGPKPPLIDICLESLEKWNPGKVRVLGPDDLPGEILEQTTGIARAFRSDLVRLWALLEEGGIWVDADTLCVGALTEIELVRELDLFGVFNRHQTRGWGAGGILATPLGGRRNSPVLKEMYRECRELTRRMRSGGKVPYGQTSVGLASAAWRRHGSSPRVRRREHWQLHPVPWYRARQVFFQESPSHVHEWRGHWNPNAKLYHLTNVVKDAFQGHSRCQLLKGPTFLEFVAQKALSERPAIYGRSSEILKRLSSGPIRGAEVGVFRAMNARHLLQQRKDLELLLVDLWDEHPQGSYRKSGDYQSRFPRSRWDHIFRTVVPRHLKFAEGRYRLDRRRSCEAARDVDDGSLDFVFIDGDHSYAGVQADLEAWSPKVKRGGFLGGHDYSHPKEGRGYGVKQAVDEFARRLAAPLERGIDWTWFIRIGS